MLGRLASFPKSTFATLANRSFVFLKPPIVRPLLASRKLYSLKGYQLSAMQSQTKDRPLDRSLSLLGRAAENFDRPAASHPAPRSTAVQSTLKDFGRKPSSGQRLHQRKQGVPPSFRSPPAVPKPAPSTPSLAAAMRSKKASSLAAALDNTYDSFQENVPPPTPDTATSSGISALREAVYFDENDFEDEAILDEQLQAPLLNPNLAAAAESIRSPSPAPPSPSSSAPVTARSSILNSHQRVEIQPGEPRSSAPIPWSSSPAEHLQYKPPSLAQEPQISRKHEALDPDPPSQPKKKRTLPWAAKRDPSAKPSHSKELWNTAGSEELKQGIKKLRAQAQSHRVKQQAGQLMENALMHMKDRKRPPRIFLSEEQKAVLQMVGEHGKSVFFTGAAGTGKSVLLRELISTLKRKYKKEPEMVAVTASTGLAACNVGGVTLHSFAGIGLGKEDVPDLVRKIKRNNKARSRWARTKVLIVDEISMVDGDLFDKLESIARIIKNNAQPFGGIQLVITGDFLQLPPVVEGNNSSSKSSKFAFDAKTWSSCMTYTVGLTQVFRQRDPVFAGMLNEMRLGKLSSRTIQEFRKLSRPLPAEHGITPTELFPTRNEVDSANLSKMRRLAGEGMVFKAEDSGSVVDKEFRNKLLQSCMAPSSLELRVGSQVMLIKNRDETLVNGSLGRVVGFMSEGSYDIAVEGGHLDEIDAANIDAESEEMSKGVQRIRNLARRGLDTARHWPLVQFMLPDGTSRSVLIPPESWKIELPNGEVQASRSQVPLILAWALSIHKAQGQTLERVKVDLGRVFEKGQAYVALSRATTMAGLQVLRFDPKKVLAHDKVREFYTNLNQPHDAIKQIREDRRQLEKRTRLPPSKKPGEIKVLDDSDEDITLTQNYLLREG